MTHFTPITDAELDAYESGRYEDSYVIRRLVAEVRRAREGKSVDSSATGCNPVSFESAGASPALPTICRFCKGKDGYHHKRCLLA